MQNSDYNSDANVENNNVIENKKVVSAVLDSNNQLAASTSEPDSVNISDISITQSASNYNPNYRKYVTLRVKLYNNGPNTANNITVSYLLNNHYLKWISDDGKGSYNHITGIWSIQTLANSTNITLHVVSQIIKSNIIITNNAVYKSGSTTDPNTLNNMSLTSLNIPPSADISVTQTASNYNPKYLHHICLVFQVKNKGPNDARYLVINTGLNPNLLKYISCYGNGHYNYNTGVWTISTLKNGSINTHTYLCEGTCL